MAAACIVTSVSPATMAFLCPECGGDAWRLPPQALPCIGYSVVFQTILGYVSQAWALRRAESSVASLWATAQPVVTACVTCMLLTCGINPGSVLEWPGRELFGAALIVAGLCVTEGAAAARLSRDSSSSDNSNRNHHHHSSCTAVALPH